MKDQEKKYQQEIERFIIIQQKLVPEIIPSILFRYQILRTIRFLQPIGRRSLAEYLHSQERRIRNEIDLLREQELISSNISGMQITNDGEAVLSEMEFFIREVQGFSLLEEKLAKFFKIKKVIVVPGDSDQDLYVKKDLARVTAAYITQKLQNGAVLAVTGGTTVAEVGGAFLQQQHKKEIIVVPARGGLGEEMEIQANTIAAGIAKGLGATYRLLHVSDDLQLETMQTIANEPRIKEVLELLRRSDMVLHGIGLATEMAKRRGLPEDRMNYLQERGAVGEAFGYYFSADGELVYSTSSLGLQLGELSEIKELITVVGGRSKACAVKAVLAHIPRNTLIIDEGAAQGVLELVD